MVDIRDLKEDQVCGLSFTGSNRDAYDLGKHDERAVILEILGYRSNGDYALTCQENSDIPGDEGVNFAVTDAADLEIESVITELERIARGGFPSLISEILTLRNVATRINEIVKRGQTDA